MSTEQYSGIGDGKPSSKVLKPPGGGSSNIFGFGPPTSQDKPKPASGAEQGAAASASAATATASAATATASAAAATASAAAPISTPETVAEPKQKRGQIFVRNPITGEVSARVQSTEHMAPTPLIYRNRRIHRNPITHEITDYSKVVQKNTGEAAVVENKPEGKKPEDKDEEKAPTRSKKIPPGGASSLKFF